MKMPLNGLTGIQQSYRGYMYSTISFILHHDDENDYNLPFSDIHQTGGVLFTKKEKNKKKKKQE